MNKPKINDKTTNIVESDYKENECDDKSSRLETIPKKENKTCITTHESEKVNTVEISFNEPNTRQNDVIEYKIRDNITKHKIHNNE